MDHLTVDEIIRFVSLTEWSCEARALSAAVNGHIRKCGMCLRRVRAFQLIYDKFLRLNPGEDFQKYFSENIAEDLFSYDDLIESGPAYEAFDGL